MTAIKEIVRIHDLLERWRAMGSRKLSNGTELLAPAQVDDDVAWMHMVFPGMSPRQLQALENDIGRSLPRRLRAFYSRIGGMELFQGAFRVFGRRRTGARLGDAALQPPDLVALNHELEAIGWLPEGAVAFAVNSWDSSVHVAGMSSEPHEILRCDRATGSVSEKHHDIWSCIAHRLYKLDDLLLT